MDKVVSGTDSEGSGDSEVSMGAVSVPTGVVSGVGSGVSGVSEVSTGVVSSGVVSTGIVSSGVVSTGVSGVSTGVHCDVVLLQYRTILVTANLLFLWYFVRNGTIFVVLFLWLLCDSISDLSDSSQRSQDSTVQKFMTNT